MNWRLTTTDGETIPFETAAELFDFVLERMLIAGEIE